MASQLSLVLPGTWFLAWVEVAGLSFYKEAGHQFLRGVCDGLLALTRVPGVSTILTMGGKARGIMRLLRIT